MRHCDFRRGKKLGIGDHIVQWQRPQQCPQSMSAADFAALPASIEVREVHLLLNNQGSQGNHFGHHLSRLKRYSQARLAQLYQLRWQRSQFQASQNNLEDGDDFCENS